MSTLFLPAQLLEGNMLRVSYKNTFLSFYEGNDEDNEDCILATRGRLASSPRSRSVESPKSKPEDLDDDSQIVKLNRLLDQELPPPSRSCSPATKSPAGGGAINKGRVAKGGALPDILAQCQPPSTPPMQPEYMEGPSAEELKQLQRRLEAVCSARSSREDPTPPNTSLAANSSQVRTNGASFCSAHSSEGAEDQRGLAGIPHVWSFTSVSTMASEEPQEQVQDGAQIEFDLVMEEEDPQADNSVCKSSGDARPEWTAPDPLELPMHRVSGSSRGRGAAEPDSRQGRRGSPNSASPAQDGPYLPHGRHGREGRRNLPQHSQQSSGRSSPTGRRSPVCSSPKSGQSSPGGRRSQQSGRESPAPQYRHGHVPKNLNLVEEYGQSSGPPTTLMIRNIPNRYTQRELIAELEELGFGSTFDFLYMPLDKGTMSNVGYAFVNFIDPAWAEKCFNLFQSYRFQRHRKISGKIAAISVAHIQGLEANLAHYENAAVNTAKLKQRRPVVFANIAQSLSESV